ncbi:MAG: hypothetical protein QW179_05190 [Candidatus Hadarchaeales archaeon]
MAGRKCGICAGELLRKEERQRKICTTCWKMGYRVPLLNRRVFILSRKTTGVVRMVDRERKEARVELPGESRATAYWKKGGWFSIFDLRIWTRKRARKFKKDEKLWRKEPLG